MAKVRIVLDEDGIGEVLKSEGAAAICNEYAGQVLGRLPEGYATEQHLSADGKRVLVEVYAATVKARINDLRTNALLKAGGV